MKNVLAIIFILLFATSVYAKDIDPNYQWGIYVIDMDDDENKQHFGDQELTIRLKKTGDKPTIKAKVKNLTTGESNDTTGSFSNIHFNKDGLVVFQFSGQENCKILINSDNKYFIACMSVKGNKLSMFNATLIKL